MGLSEVFLSAGCTILSPRGHHRHNVLFYVKLDAFLTNGRSDIDLCSAVVTSELYIFHPFFHSGGNP